MSYILMKVDIRIEGNLKSFVTELANRSRWTVGDVVRELAWLGTGVKKGGGAIIEGPFGLRRFLSKWDFGGERERLTVWIQEDLVHVLETEFGTNARRALREAIRLGTLAFNPSSVKVMGPFGYERPFAICEPSEIQDDRARQALERLKEIQ